KSASPSSGQRQLYRETGSQIAVPAQCALRAIAGTGGGSLPRPQIHPYNLWVLRGLLNCLQRRGEVAEATPIRQRNRATGEFAPQSRPAASLLSLPRRGDERCRSAKRMQRSEL